MPTREITATVATAAGELTLAGDEALELTVDRQNTAAELTAQGLIDDAPDSDTELEVSILDERVFTGTLTDPQTTGDGRTKLRAYDAARDLKRATLTMTFEKADISSIVKAACEEAGVKYEIDLPSAFTSAEYTDDRCDAIVQKIADMGQAVWVVDPTNTVRVIQQSNLGSLTTEHQLESVIDTSAGKATPAYQSVHIYGSSPASAGASDRAGGRSAMHLIASAPVSATAGEGDPTYTYIDDDIRTEEQAQNVADRLYQELQAQQQGGWIDIVGDPAIRPYDTVTLPESLGGAQYLVSGVRHRLGIDNGFTTRIQCGGVIEP